jgi:predicted flap endonuclease-1-like 5' DNA nuclease
LFLLGSAIGFVVGWAWNVDNAPALFFGLLLVVVGAIIGFLTEWVIDVAYRRNRELQFRLAHQREQPASLSADSRTASPVDENVSETLSDFLHRRDEELKELRQQLAETTAQLDTVQDDFDRYQRYHPDDLTVIKGIGPVYQRKLREIGFNTYRQLVEADPDRIRRMLDVKKWQRVNVESWIEQAHDWAQRNQ